jgi:hypothetical protein
MTFVVADGPPGLEAVHSWNGGIALNTQGSLPRIKLDRLTGYHSLPDADANFADFTGRRGERALPSLERGKTITYEGRIFGRSFEELRRQINLMRASFRDRSREYEMRVIPADGTVWFYTARVLELSIDDEQTQGPWFRTWQRQFILGLRQMDPRFYVDLLQNTGALGPGSHNLDVGGLADTDPVITLTVPAGEPDVTISNGAVAGGNGAAARLRFRNVPEGVMTLDFRNRRVRIGGVDMSALLDGTFSTWWDEEVPGLIPGTNILQMEGATDISVSFRAAA